MSILKLLLAIIGIIIGAYFIFWVLGILGSLLWYGIMLALVGGVVYGGYRLFRKAEDRYVGAGPATGEIDGRDFNMSWDEYEKKYLHK